MTDTFNPNQARATKGTPDGGKWVTTPKADGADAGHIGVVTPTGKPAWAVETRRKRRGHDFYPKDIATWPALYATDGVPPGAKEVLAHYFSPNKDWFVVEVDQATGDAFGYAYTGGDSARGEWGYFNLPEIESLGDPRPMYCTEREIYTSKGSLIRHEVDRYATATGPVEKLSHSPKDAETVNDLADLHAEIRAGLYALNDSGDDAYCDRFVDSIVDGQLSRAVPGKAAAEAVTAWRVHAAQLAGAVEGASEFQAGIEKAVVHLYASKFDALGAVPAGGGRELEDLARQAIEFAKTKRASADDREEWRQALKTAKSKAEWNGMLVAAAALSGTESWWGFRDDVRATITHGSGS